MKNFIFVFLVSSFYLFGQSENKINLSGSLINDTQFALSAISDSNNSVKLNITQNKKTPILAGLMSFALPGAGQIYTEDYLMAGIFAAVEVGAVIIAITYDSKGDDQTKFFENYAHEHWSAERYARWTINNLDFLNSQTGNDLTASDYALFNTNGSLNWSELNKLEEDIKSYYSHKLAPFGDQQYYEMIGKYSQFNVGWDQFGDENTPYNWYAGDGVIDQFQYYSVERGKANDFYTVAKWAVIAVVSNHFISAFEAAWSASRYNKKMSFNISLEEETLGYYKEYYPQINIKYNF